ncbi:MAG: hypothetical protein E7350_01250 [Clostridiales bacterium]|nr:hypothetical protein [Clostridiales bacterium]
MNSVLIVALCALCGLMIGLSLTKRQREREAYYREFNGLCAHIISNISYRADKIADVVDGIEWQSSALRKNMEEYKAYVSGGELSLTQGVLTKGELAAVKEFFLRLGRYDGETQLAELKQRQSELTIRYKEIKDKNDIQGNMYVKLGFLAGLLLGILLI